MCFLFQKEVILSKISQVSLNQNNLVKTGLFASLALSVILLFSFFRIYDKYTTLSKKSKVENEILQNQFNEILLKYDSIQDFKFADSAFLMEHQKKVTVTPAQMELRKRKNLSMEEKIEMLKEAIQLDQVSIYELQEKIELNSESLRQLESDLVESKYEEDKLTVLNINARGVKILSDLYSNARDKKIQQIRVCFTLEGNEFIKAGEKNIMVQVVNPNKQVISVNQTFFEDKGQKFFYTGAVKAMYNKKDTDVCTYVDLEDEKTIKGKYHVNIYYNSIKIGSTIFQYN